MEDEAERFMGKVVGTIKMYRKRSQVTVKDEKTQTAHRIRTAARYEKNLRTQLIYTYTIFSPNLGESREWPWDQKQTQTNEK